MNLRKVSEAWVIWKKMLLTSTAKIDQNYAEQIGFLFAEILSMALCECA